MIINEMKIDEDDILDIFIVGSGFTSVSTLDQINSLKFKFCYGSDDLNLSSIPKSNTQPLKLPKAMKTSDSKILNYIVPGYLDFQKKINVKPLHSLTKNGFSNVWGSAILPLPRNTSRLWEKKFNILLNLDFDHLLSIFPKSNFGKDNINDFFELPIDDNNKGDLNDKRFQKKIDKAYKLTNSNFTVMGKTRLAINSNFDFIKDDLKCIKCKLCLSGCSYNSILRSEDLIKDKDLEHLVPNYIVTELIESGDHVEVRGIKNNSPYSLKAKRVFLAAGTVGSAKIILNSNLGVKNIYIQDTATKYEIFFILPRLSKSSSEGTSLSQLTSIYFKKNHEIISLSQYYEISKNLLQENLSFFAKSRFFSLIAKYVENFILIGITFCNSESSDMIQVSKLEDGLIAKKAKRRANLVKKIQENLSRNIKLMRYGFFKIPFVTINNSPGAGVHSGSWLTSPEGVPVLDKLGRINQNSRIHVVDSSSLPELPVGPITLIASANARRISRAVAGFYKGSF